MIVTVEEVKEHLRIQHDEEDKLIERLIQQAQAAAEDFCRVSFEQKVAPIGLRARKVRTSDAGSDPQPVSMPAAIPEPVRLAVLLMVSYYYENRDVPDMTDYKVMRMAFENLLYPYRDPEKMF